MVAAYDLWKVNSWSIFDLTSDQAIRKAYAGARKHQGLIVNIWHPFTASSWITLRLGPLKECGCYMYSVCHWTSHKTVGYRTPLLNLIKEGLEMVTNWFLNICNACPMIHNVELLGMDLICIPKLENPFSKYLQGRCLRTALVLPIKKTTPGNQGHLPYTNHPHKRCESLLIDQYNVLLLATKKHKSMCCWESNSLDQQTWFPFFYWVLETQVQVLIFL